MSEDYANRFDSSLFDRPGGSSQSQCRSGYLLVKINKKRRFKLAAWQRKYFVLDSDGLLSYYDNATAVSCRGTALLQQRTKILLSEFRPFCFEIRTPTQKKIVLAGESEDERSDWVGSLQLACKNSPPRPIKICLVGDDGETQKQLLRLFFLECHQNKLASKVTTTENLELNLEVTGEKVRLILCVISASDFPKLRVLNYVNANAFMLCYNSSSLSTFRNIENLWLPEIKSNVKSSKNPTVFLVSLVQEDKAQTVDRLVGEELSDFLGASSFFHVQLSNNNNNNGDDNNNNNNKNNRKNNVKSSFSEISESDSACVTPAETFLTILESTLEEIDETLIDNESNVTSETDVANMKDFTQNSFSDFVKVHTKKMNNFITSQTKKLRTIASKANLHISMNAKNLNLKALNISNSNVNNNLHELNKVSTITTTTTSSLTSKFTDVNNKSKKGKLVPKKGGKEELDEETLGTLVKLRLALKKLRPKKDVTKNKNKEEREKLDPKMKSTAHFVDRTETGSLVFLGENFLSNEDNDE